MSQTNPDHIIEDVSDDEEEDFFENNVFGTTENEACPYDEDIQKFMYMMKKSPEEMRGRLKTDPNGIFGDYPHITQQSEKDGRTVLHCVIDELSLARPPLLNALALAVRTFTKRCPSLLKKPAKNGATPLYNAIQYCSAGRRHWLVRAILQACGKTKTATKDGTMHELTEALAMMCNSSSGNNSETVLHLLMRNQPAFASNMEDFRQLACHASEATVLSLDGKNLTPLHFAVTYEWSSEIQHDIVMMLLKKGESEELIKQGKAVLDLHSQDVSSIYQYHLETRKKYKEPEPPASKPNQQKSSSADSRKSGPGDLKKDGPSEAKKHSSGESRKDGPGGKEGPGGPKQTPNAKQDAVPGRDGGEKKNKKISAGDGHVPISPDGRELSRSSTAPPGALQNTPVASGKGNDPERSPEERRKIRDEWSSKIQTSLKIWCLRTRGHEGSTRFLYGANPDDIQTWFDYSGVAEKIEAESFKETFKDVRFDTVLQYVAFSPVRVERSGKKGERVSHVSGRGRSDMVFFFEWLKKEKKVERILRVIVDDSSEEPHSDDAIEQALQGFGVEWLDWSKPDLDPDTIFKACPELTRIVLRWSGNNAVLRAWSEPEGLRRLSNLERVEIVLEDQIRGVETPERTKTNIANFERRLKETCPQYVEEYLNNNTKPAAIATNMGPPPQPRRGLVHTVEDISVTDVYGLQRPSASINGSDSSSNRTRNKTPTHRWLESTDAFATRIENIWRKSVEIKRQPSKLAGGNDTPSSANTSAALTSGLRPDQVPEDVIVALIDDGVDTMAEHLSGRILPGRTFGFEGDRNLPWYASESGHGTVMATMIARVCPMAKIYPIRLNTGAKLKAGSGSATTRSDITLLNLVKQLDTA